jgi:hypothetical protein
LKFADIKEVVDSDIHHWKLVKGRLELVEVGYHQYFFFLNSYDINASLRKCSSRREMVLSGYPLQTKKSIL